MLAGLGLSLVGTGLGVAAAQQDKNAMNSAVQQSLNEQAGYTKKANSAVQGNINQQTGDTARKQIATGAAQQSDLYKSLQSSKLQNQSSVAGMDPVTQARTEAFVDQQNRAGSQLAGYGNYATQSGLSNLEGNEQLGIIGTNAKNALDILPYQIQAAGHTGDKLAFAGTGLSTLGSLAGLFGVLNKLKAPGNTPAVNPNANAPQPNVGMIPMDSGYGVPGDPGFGTVPSYLKNFSSQMGGNPFLF